LHANARLVFVLDPAGRLTLRTEITAGGLTWPVHHYDGNDLSLRAGLARAGWTASRPGTRGLIWVTAPRGSAAGSSPRIRLSSLADLLAVADDVVDLSLSGVFSELMPNERWPMEALARHEQTFASNLPIVVAGHAELRHHLPHGTVLDVHAVRALALHARQPGVPIGELLFQRDSPAQVLQRYIRLAWGAAWDQEAQALLREHARSSPQTRITNVAAWFEPSLEALSIYLYLRRLLGQARVSSIATRCAASASWISTRSRWNRGWRAS